MAGDEPRASSARTWWTQHTTLHLSRTLRSVCALAALLGNFLIPLAVTDLRGATHIVTCKADVQTPFTLIRDASGHVTQLSSQVISRDDPDQTGSAGTELCGGLTVAMATRSAEDDGTVRLNLPITNHTDDTWKGSVAIRFDGVTVPIDVGEIGPGDTETSDVTLHLDTGTNELTGSILVGP